MLVMSQQAIVLPVLFTGEARAHGLRQRDPATGANIVTCIALGHDPEKHYVALDLRIDQSTDPDNAGLVFRVFFHQANTSMASGRVKALEAEHKALKIAFWPAENQTQENMEPINSAKGAAVSYNYDFAGKQACMWFEPKNPDAPKGKENKGKTGYDQGFDKIRWITHALHADVLSGKVIPGLVNTPLKGGGQAALGVVPSVVPGVVPNAPGAGGFRSAVSPANGAGAPVPPTAPTVQPAAAPAPAQPSPSGGSLF